jgi:hypothetical protein
LSNYEKTTPSCQFLFRSTTNRVPTKSKSIKDAIGGQALYKISKLMDNSPDICRRHYAALIPEEMTEVVEFSDNQKKAVEDDDTKVMLKKILTRLDGEKQNQPKLKLVHFGKED